ncbi:hypothetical protein N566_11695 [Streptomycetaceae bacterium MP113-05]|nr:hypothetical protein N566_11695 [Streptomycetaceae bacterium MP113-05]
MPTPIYETLVREWSLAGRDVPGRSRHGRSESPEFPGPWWHADEARTSYGSHRLPAPSAPPAPPAAPVPVSPQTRGDGSYGTFPDPYGSPFPAPYRSVTPYVGVSGYGDGGDDGTGGDAGPLAHPAVPPATGEAEASRPKPAAEPAPPAAAEKPQRGGWERVAIL